MKPIKVTIMGRQYPLKVEEGDEEMMNRIASFVNQRFQDFKKTLVNQPESTIMVLASLSIAEELFLQSDQSEPSPPEEKERIFSEVNTSLRQILDDFESEFNDI
ncbi:cell division protein ZapA [Balneolaceae bacterium ANBcel3]|nr:cell division protein ZapA [Balneolaceae bacterium ANBcel3]